MTVLRQCLLTVCLGFFASACIDSRTQTIAPDTGAARLGASLQTGPISDRIRGLQRDFYDLAVQSPGFAGVVVDPVARSAQILVSTSGIEGRIRPHVDSLFQRRAAHSRGALAVPATVGYRRVKYDYVQLARWFTQIESIVGDSAVTAWALSEARNAVIIDVSRASEIGRIRSRILALGVPEDAVFIEVSVPELSGALTDHFLAATGGIRVTNLDRSDACTLGANAYSGTTRTFLTASHCTAEIYGQDRALSEGFGQPDASYWIGREFRDYAGAPCPSGEGLNGLQCRYSDAALIALSSTYQWNFGHLAWTSGGNTYDFEAVMEGEGHDRELMGGEIVHLIGSQSGHVQGTVTLVSVQTKLHDLGALIPYAVLDAVRVDGEAAGGDSGGPVVIATGMASLHIMYAWLEGIEFAKGTTSEGVKHFYFSRLSNIKSELGPLSVSKVSVIVEGPTRQKEEGPYRYSANAVGSSSGLTPAYTYQWEKKVEGFSWTNVGTDSVYFDWLKYTTPGTYWRFFLRVTATGGTEPEQTARSDSITVVVCDGTQPPCPPG